MISRVIGEHHGTPPPPSKTPTHPYSWDASAFLGSESDDLETGKSAYKNNFRYSQNIVPDMSYENEHK